MVKTTFSSGHYATPATHFARTNPSPVVDYWSLMRKNWSVDMIVLVLSCDTLRYTCNAQGQRTHFTRTNTDPIVDSWSLMRKYLSPDVKVLVLRFGILVLGRILVHGGGGVNTDNSGAQDYVE